MPCFAVLCCAVSCCDVPCCVMLCCGVLCCVVLCCAVDCCPVPCFAMLCRAVLCHAVTCRAVPCCAVPCCACNQLSCVHCSHDSDVMTQTELCMLSSHIICHVMTLLFLLEICQDLADVNANLTLILYCQSGLTVREGGKPRQTLPCFWREVGSRQNSQTCSMFQAASLKLILGWIR